MIIGTISQADYLNAQKLHRARSAEWYYLTSLVAFALGLLIYFLFNRNIGLIVACAGIGGVVGELLMSTVYLPRQVRRLHNQQKDLASPFTYQWDSMFLEAQGISGQSKRAWKNYAKYKEDEKIFLLYHADNLFEMFPKRWFRDEAQVSEFRGLANQAGKA